MDRFDVIASYDQISFERSHGPDAGRSNDKTSKSQTTKRNESTELVQSWIMTENTVPQHSWPPRLPLCPPLEISHLNDPTVTPHRSTQLVALFAFAMSCCGLARLCLLTVARPLLLAALDGERVQRLSLPPAFRRKERSNSDRGSATSKMARRHPTG